MSAIASEGVRCADDHVAAEHEAVLSCIGPDHRFSGPRAPTSVSFDVRSGEILGLAGLNGRGKATTVNVAIGFMRPASDPLARTSCSKPAYQARS